MNIYDLNIDGHTKSIYVAHYTLLRVMLSLMSISRYECEIITQIHHLGCRGLSVATIYGQGKVREFLFPDPV